MTYAQEVPIIRSIVEQHAEEAAFLWLLRDAALRQPHYDLNDLSELDNRVEAHVDGLRIAGIPGWEICKRALAIEEPGEVFAAAVMAFEGDDGRCVDDLVKVGALTNENFRALVSALGWVSNEDQQRWVPSFINAKSLTYRRLGLAGSVIRRQDIGDALVAALNDPEAVFQARALRAVGELKKRDLLPMLRECLQHDDAGCRFWAAWSAVLLGERNAVESLKTFATLDSSYCEQSLQLALRVMDSREAQPWLKGLAAYPEALRYVIIGTGVVGDPLIMPWLFEQMENPELARIAGETFSMITGIDIAYEDLEGEWPEGFEAGPTENPEDDDVAMDADEDFPWPNRPLIQAWWHKNQQWFQPGTRYLCGQPITVENCQRVLRKGYQRQRRAAALELALLQRDAPVFNTSAPGFRQQKMLNPV